MEIIYVHLGTTTNSYLKDAIERSISLFPDIKHTLIMDNLDSIGIHSLAVNLVKNESKILESETLHREVDLNFRKGYWNSTLERIFSVLDYQIKNNIENILHVESDVILLPTFPFNSITECKFIHWCEYGERHDVASLLHIPNSKEANLIRNQMVSTLKFEPNLTDMQLLYLTRSKLKNVRLFPSEGKDPCTPSLNFGSSNCECFPNNFIFDGLTYGMYITGQDPRNNYGRYSVGDNSPFEFGATQINPRKYSWSLDNSGLLGAKSLCCGKLFELQNIHVHSKNKKLFRLKWQKSLFKLIIIANKHNRVNFFNLRSVYEMLKCSIKDGKTRLFFENSPPVTQLKRIILFLVKGK
jgi:hypothetical protein